jgi:hypothetical protein
MTAHRQTPEQANRRKETMNAHRRLVAAGVVVPFSPQVIAGGIASTAGAFVFAKAMAIKAQAETGALTAPKDVVEAAMTIMSQRQAVNR